MAFPMISILVRAKIKTLITSNVTTRSCRYRLLSLKNVCMKYLRWQPASSFMSCTPLYYKSIRQEIKACKKPFVLSDSVLYNGETDFYRKDLRMTPLLKKKLDHLTALARKQNNMIDSTDIAREFPGVHLTEEHLNIIHPKIFLIQKKLITIYSKQRIIF